MKHAREIWSIPRYFDFCGVELLVISSYHVDGKAECQSQFVPSTDLCWCWDGQMVKVLGYVDDGTQKVSVYFSGRPLLALVLHSFLVDFKMDFASAGLMILKFCDQSSMLVNYL